MSAVTQNEYTQNDNTTVLRNFTFPYLKTSDIKVSLDGVATTAFTLPNATTIQLNSVPPNGTKIRIFRETGIDDLTATFYAGSAIKSEDLNDNFTQNLYVTQEVNQRFINTLGGSMIGDLNMGEDSEIIFEGATDNDNETKLSVVDPTADQTYRLPNLSAGTYDLVSTGDTGTVATGMIAADAVNGDKIADNAINSEHYTDGSIDRVHLAADIVDGTKIADDSINSEHYVADSIDTEHYAAGSVDATALASNAVTRVKIIADAVDGTKIADDSINSEHYVDGSIDNAHIADNAINQAKMADDSIGAAEIIDNAVGSAALASNAVTLAKMADNSVGTSELVNDSVTGAKIADDQINSEHYVDQSIDNQHLADNAVTNSKLADDAVGSNELGDGVIDTVHIGTGQITNSLLASNAVTEAKITDANITEAKLAANSVTISKIGCEQTTLTDSDSHIPTSGAVIDYVAAQLAPLGGFEAIANEQSFPNTQPAAGVVISIADAGGLAVSNSGTASGQTVGGTTVNITGIASNFNGTTVSAGVRFLVASTGSGQNYTYHKATLKEDDLINLSGDINDFSERYRVGSSNPTSSLDNGDLFFNTSTGKLLVYNGTNSAWEEAQSIGNFFISTLSPAFNGSAIDFTLSNAPTNVQQVLLSINGVIQKPNAGTSRPSEGFSLNGSTIQLPTGSAPAAGSDYFAIVMGSTVNIGTPSNNTVSTAILQNDSVNADKIAAGAVGSTELAADAVITSKIADSAITNAKVNASAAIAGTKISPDFGSQDITTTGALNTQGTHTIGGTFPQIFLEDSDNNSDFRLQNSNGTFIIKDHTNSANRFRIASNGTVSVTNNLNAESGLDVTGNITVSGTVDGVDIAALNTTVGNLSTDIVSDTSPQLGGGLDTNGHDIHFGDSASTNDDNLYFGADNDLRIYYDGSHSRIVQDTSGFLIVQANNYLFKDNANNHTTAHFKAGAEVELYHNGSKKFETTSGGATVTGTCTATAFAGDGSALTGISAFVSGMIMMYNSTTPPSGWYLCNGQNGTPDLRDRFVIGAGNSYSQGATGGSTTDSVNISVSGSGTTGNQNWQSGSGQYRPTSGWSQSGHNHSFSFSGSGSDTISTMSPYYALTFIMKA